MKISIKINGKTSEASVTQAVVNQFSSHLENKQISINHQIDFPISAGFGASGAGALSTAFALNELVGKVFDDIKCGQIAHTAEVLNKTGLGDVIAQFQGGFEMRVREGAPGVGRLEKIDIATGKLVVLGSWGILETKKVLNNLIDRNRIIKSGESILDDIFKRNQYDLSYLCKKGQEFSRSIDLESNELKEVLTKLTENGFNDCGMVMLGNTFYCFSNEEDIPEILAIINQLKSKPTYFISEIPSSGVKII